MKDYFYVFKIMKVKVNMEKKSSFSKQCKKYYKGKYM